MQKGGVESKTSERVVENPTTVLVQRECEDDKDTFEGSEDQNTIIIQLFIPCMRSKSQVKWLKYFPNSHSLFLYGVLYWADGAM